MAIDDNTSYELTGAQVKDLASKIKAKANTTDLPSVMTGATSQAAGAAGLVPAPTTSDVDKYLKGDGTWAAVSGGSSDAVTLYATLDSSTNRFTFYHDASHTQAVLWNEFVALAEAKNIAFVYAEESTNDPYTIQVVSSSLWTSDNKIVFFGFWYDEFTEFTWSSSNSYVATSPAHASAGVDVWYATSSSSATSSTKSARIQGGGGAFTLQTGTVVFVKFTYQNTSTNTLSLNVDNSGSKSVYVNGSQTDASYTWNANDVVGFVYDGTYWRMLSHGKATTSSYGKVKLSSSWANNDSSVVPTSAHLYQVYLVADGKQDQLTAGTGIAIDQNNVISATGGSYTYSGSVDTINNSFTTTLSDGTTAQSATLNAGTGITFSSTSSGPSVVGPTPANTSTDATQISGLTFTPGAAGTGYFYVLRVGKSSSMSGDVYSARLYKSNQSFNFTSQAEVEAAIWPNGQQIDVNPNNSGAMSGFFDSSFQSIEYVSGRSTAAEAIAAVYTAQATFGGTVTFDSKHVYVDAYVYVMGQGANTLTISATSNVVQTTGQSTTDVMSQKAVTDIIGNVETILQTLNSGNGAQ